MGHSGRRDNCHRGWLRRDRQAWTVSAPERFHALRARPDRRESGTPRSSACPPRSIAHYEDRKVLMRCPVVARTGPLRCFVDSQGCLGMNLSCRRDNRHRGWLWRGRQAWTAPMQERCHALCTRADSHESVAPRRFAHSARSIVRYENKKTLMRCTIVARTWPLPMRASKGKSRRLRAPWHRNSGAIRRYHH